MTAATRMMCGGDSMTCGSGNPAPFGDGAYRVPLARRIVEAGYAVHMVGRKNENPPPGLPAAQRGSSAQGGWKVVNLYGEITGGALRDYPADVFALMIGHNDAAANTPNIVTDYTALCTAILEARPLGSLALVIGTIPPTTQAYNAYITTLNAAIFSTILPALKAAGWPKLEWAPTGDIPLSMLGPDGVHPTIAGYERMADLWLQSLVRWL